MPNKGTDYLDVQCSHAKPEGKEQFNKSLSTNFDVLPLFEQQYNVFLRTRLYSLRTNEKLNSRWHDRVLGQEAVAGVRTIPIPSDYHFHNCRIQLMPSLSPSNFSTLRKHLVPGPGVDKFGHRPIPADMMDRKTENLVTERQKQKAYQTAT